LLTEKGAQAEKRFRVRDIIELLIGIDERTPKEIRRVFD
jgi:hypothetical protein